jgi:hypothetical protein
MRTLVVCCLAAVTALAMEDRSSASIVTDTQAQRDFTGRFRRPLRITRRPFDFSGQGYELWTTIDSLTITLWVEDGDTALGNFDNGQWTLGLDDVDTGLLLDGFPNDWTAVEKTFTQIPVDTQEDILARLKEDGQLVPYIIDADYRDNRIGLCKEPHDSTLIISGDSGQIPEPSTMVIWSLLGASVATVSWRRRRLSA